MVPSQKTEKCTSSCWSIGSGFPSAPPVEQEIPEERRVNPKRARREIQRKELSARPGTKSQQALALQREAAKASRQEDARQRKEREREEKFQIRQRKRKEKHRGR